MNGQTGLTLNRQSCGGALGALVLRADAQEARADGKSVALSGIETVVVFLKGKLRKGVGPLDIALSILAATKKSGLLNNKILEFVGGGVSALSMEYRLAVDKFIRASECLATVWETDEKTQEFFVAHGRAGDYKELKAEQPAYYDGGVSVDLSRVEPMIALPYLKTNIYELKDFLSRPEELLRRAEEACEKTTGEKVDLLSAFREGKVFAGGAAVPEAEYETAAEVAEILRGKGVGKGAYFVRLSPASLPVYKCLAENGYLSLLAAEGVSVNAPDDDMSKSDSLVVYHGVEEGGFLMDARSLAATALNGGAIASALGAEYVKRIKKYKYDGEVYSR